MKPRTPTVNRLHKMALEYSDMLDDSSLRNRNITDIYYDAKPKMLAAGELINCQFNGLPGSGKSTAMIAEVFHTNILLRKKTTLDHILPNQIVYAQVMKQITSVLNACIGIDEYDELGETGYNATTEKSALNHYSDLHRANYVHKYACAPKDTFDKNAYLIFEVIAPDKKHEYTRCLLYYKLFKGGIEIQQLLGYVDIDVSMVLHTKFYAEYEKRKMHRLQLFNKHGITHERHIFSAKLVLGAYDDLRAMARFSHINRDSCRLKVDIVAREQKVMNSILTTEKTAGDLMAILGYVKEIEKLTKQIKKLNRLRGKEPSVVIDKAIKHLTQTIDALAAEEDKTLTYWKVAAGLEKMYISQLGLNKQILLKKNTNTKQKQNKTGVRYYLKTP